MDQITVVTPSLKKIADVESAPIRNLMSLFSNSKTAQERVRLYGVVVKVYDDQITVEDPTGRVAVETVQASPLLEGQRVEIIGYLEEKNGEIVVTDGLIQQIQNTSVPDQSKMVARNNVPLKEITNIADIFRLGEDKKSWDNPIHITGVVTYCDPDWEALFIQNGDGAIFVTHWKSSVDLKPGMELDVKGLCISGTSQPMISNAVVRVIGCHPLPQIERVTVPDLIHANRDCRWVEMEGVVDNLVDNWGHIILELRNANGRFQASIPGFKDRPIPTNYLGAKILIRGAAAVTITPMGQVKGIVLHVPGTNDVTILTSAPADPFSLPVRKIKDLMQANIRDLGGELVKVRGVVTMVCSGTVCIQDETAGMMVEVKKKFSTQVGQLIEAVGFPEIEFASRKLQSANIRIVGNGPPIIPSKTTAERILSWPTNDLEVVQIEARILEDTSQGSYAPLVLQDGTVTFSAVCAGFSTKWSTKQFRAGSVVKVKGICSIQTGVWGTPISFQVLLRSPEDIVLVKAPPRLTWQTLAVTTGGLALVALLSAAWNVTLRTQVRRQTDLIREKLHEEAALEERYRELFENASDVIFTIDFDGNWHSLNKAACQIFGSESDKKLAPTVFKYMTPEVEERFQAMIKRLQSGTPSITEEIQVLGNDKKNTILEVGARPLLHNEHPFGLECIARNVTDRKILEEQLRQSQKMEGIGRLAGGVAHDFNNMLSVLSMHSYMIKEDFALSEEMQSRILEMEKVIERATNLTRQLLMFSRRQAMQYKIIDLNQSLSNMTKMLQRLVGEHIAIELSLWNEPMLIEADAGMIDQVIMNLCVNARDAMPKGGELKITTQPIQLDQRFALLNSEARSGPFVCMRVLDTGCGMNEETIRHIFEPFFTTKKIGKGTGLGLATIYGIVKQHKGWIDVKSTINVGTCFTVFIPLSLKALSKSPTTLNIPKLNGKHEKILLVEDEAPVRNTLKAYLEKNGYQVVEAQNGVEALRVWNEKKGDFNLLFTDSVMPEGVSGLELADQIKRQKPEIKVIISSGYCEELLNLGSARRSDLLFLDKPYNPDTLLITVRKALDRKTSSKSTQLKVTVEA